MSAVSRGVRNAFRNPIRTVSIIIIVGLSIGMALSMLVARQAVTDKIASVKQSVGNTVSVSPAGSRGFEGGGEALKAEDIAKLAALDHVTASVQTLRDRLTTDNSSLQSAVEAGSLGQRFSQNNGTGFSGGQAPTPPDQMAGGSQPGTGSTTQITRTFTPPVTVTGTTQPTDLSASQGGGTFNLTSGEVFGADSVENVAVIGKALADKNSLEVGSTFKAYNKDIKVVGIFDAGNAFANNQVLMPLKTVQTLSGQAGAVTSATLTVDSIENVASVTAAASAALGTKADVTNTSEQAETAIAPLENIRTISLYSLFGAVVAGAVIILLTMIMIVRERRREIGVIKAIGASNVKVVGQFASEAVTLTLFGAVVGIIVGILAANPITKLLVNNSTASTTATTGGAMMAGPGAGGPGGAGRVLGEAGRSLNNVTATVGWEVILYGLAVALLIAVIGSVLASFFIAKVRPAEVMRTE